MSRYIPETIDEQKMRRTNRLAWIVFLVAMSAHVFNLFQRTAGAAAVDRIMADLDITATAVGSVLAMYFYIYAAMQFPSGVFADTLGPRKTISLGSLVASIGSITFGLAPSLPFLYLGRLLISLGVSVIFISVLKLLTEWFQSKYFARITSLTAFIANIGSLLATTPMALLIMSVGWRFSYEIIGAASLVISFACWFIIRNKPEDAGLSSPLHMEQHGSAQQPSSYQEQNEATTTIGERIRLLFANKYIWPPFLINLGTYGTLLVVQSAWGIPYLMQVYTMPRASAASIILFLIIVHSFSVILIPYISDKLQKRKLPALVCTVGYLASWLVLIMWNGGKPPIPALYMIFFFMGLLTGITPLNYINVKEVVPRHISGMAMSIVNVACFASASLFQILFGVMLDIKWDGTLYEGARVYTLEAFQYGFMIVATGVLISVIGALLLKETHCRDIYDEMQANTTRSN
jgi:sugar phosphate permease